MQAQYRSQLGLFHNMNDINNFGLPEGIELIKIGVQPGEFYWGGFGICKAEHVGIDRVAHIKPADGFVFEYDQLACDSWISKKKKRKIVRVEFNMPEDYGKFRCVQYDREDGSIEAVNFWYASPHYSQGVTVEVIEK